MSGDRDPEATDRDLVSRANRGDREAMEALYFRYRDYVHTLAVSFCRNEADALDVMQETFFYLFRKFPGFELTAQMKTFLYPAVKNLSFARLKKGRRSVPLDKAREEAANGAAAATDGEPLEEFSQVLFRLSEEQRSVAVLRFVEDMELAQIAETLEIPLGTVKSRLHHAIQRLRKLLR
jgi:RNA polymerase sigma-70 factor (ECF subfamily)